MGWLRTTIAIEAAWVALFAVLGLAGGRWVPVGVLACWLAALGLVFRHAPRLGPTRTGFVLLGMSYVFWLAVTISLPLTPRGIPSPHGHAVAVPALLVDVVRLIAASLHSYAERRAATKSPHD